MMRDIFTLTPKATCWTIPMDTFEDDPVAWLSMKMQDQQLKYKYLLAHADDGVIWGRRDNTHLITSHDVVPKYSPPLRAKTLLTARIFSPLAELLVWRNENSEWAGRLITEITNPNITGEQARQPDIGPAPSTIIDEWVQAFEEKQILLGTKEESLGKDFYQMSEGLQGLLHAVPIYPGKIDDQNRTLRLVVRHYLKEDEYGFLRINASRLVNLLPEPKESNV